MAIIEISRLIDARGLACPMPIAMTARAVRALPSGAVVELLATDPDSMQDVAAWCASTGHDLLDSTSNGAVYRFIIRRA